MPTIVLVVFQKVVHSEHDYQTQNKLWGHDSTLLQTLHVVLDTAPNVSTSTDPMLLSVWQGEVVQWSHPP